MLPKTAKDERIRAEAIALQAGLEVGGLKKVNTGFSDHSSKFY